MPETMTPLATVFMTATRTVLQVLGGQNAENAFQVQDTRQWGARERAACRDLVLGSLRDWRALQFLAQKACQRSEIAPQVLLALFCVALYALRSSRVAAHVVVSQTVDAASALGLTHAKGLLNGALRGYLRRKDEFEAALADAPIGVRLSYPDWWIARLQADWPDEWMRIISAGNEKPPMAVRVNVRRLSPEAWLEKSGLAAQRFGAAGWLLASPIPVTQLYGFENGLVSVQDAGAQLCAGQLNPSAGMRVLDACSAPGNKAAAVLETRDVELTALDIDATRQAVTADTLLRLGLQANVIDGDAALPQQWWDKKPFDRILLDAPCTASGIVRRHVDSKWLKRESDLPTLVAQQRRIMKALWATLKPGGEMLYVTCSVFHAENGGQIERFLVETPDAKREGVVWPTDIDAKEGAQLLPAGGRNTHNHDGFYCVRLKKLL